VRSSVAEAGTACSREEMRNHFFAVFRSTTNEQMACFFSEIDVNSDIMNNKMFFQGEEPAEINDAHA
jgi:hypothetical protein